MSEIVPHISAALRISIISFVQVLPEDVVLDVLTRGFAKALRDPGINHTGIKDRQIRFVGRYLVIDIWGHCLENFVFDRDFSTLTELLIGSDPTRPGSKSRCVRSDWFQVLMRCLLESIDPAQVYDILYRWAHKFKRHADAYGDVRENNILLGRFAPLYQMLCSKPDLDGLFEMLKDLQKVNALLEASKGVKPKSEPKNTQAIEPSELYEALLNAPLAPEAQKVAHSKAVSPGIDDFDTDFEFVENLVLEPCLPQLDNSDDDDLVDPAPPPYTDWDEFSRFLDANITIKEPEIYEPWNPEYDRMIEMWPRIRIIDDRIVLMTLIYTPLDEIGEIYEGGKAYVTSEGHTKVTPWQTLETALVFHFDDPKRSNKRIKGFITYLDLARPDCFNLIKAWAHNKAEPGSAGTEQRWTTALLKEDKWLIYTIQGPDMFKQHLKHVQYKTARTLVLTSGTPDP